MRLPVQWVLRRPGGGRSYAGMVNGGPFRVGDPVVVLPQGAQTTLRAIETADGPLQRAEVGLSVSLRLADHLDVSRGDLIAAAEEPPEVTDTFEATVCWFQERPLKAGDRLRIKHTTRVTPVVVEGVTGVFDVNDLRITEGRALQGERHRRREAAHRHTVGGRPVPGRSHHGKLRADRRADLRHHRGRHGRATPPP